jgi:hypothetical protein
MNTIKYTYYLHCMFEEEEINKISQILQNENINSLHIDLFYNLPLQYIKNIETLMRNLSYNIENLIIMHLPLIITENIKYDVLCLDNLPISLNKIYTNNYSSLILKVPFGCDVIDINENNDSFTEYRSKIKLFLI